MLARVRRLDAEGATDVVQEGADVEARVLHVLDLPPLFLEAGLQLNLPSLPHILQHNLLIAFEVLAEGHLALLFDTPPHVRHGGPLRRAEPHYPVDDDKRGAVNPPHAVDQNHRRLLIDLA
eukprot:CAMPEP_0180222650 /NCGR_PEP_ID=MMETSP0987-20121128/20872_1 /TAXON_ID=697907 /ORGANISM="non described non described, Strain CCMP2293" /LENGTH=120 /DNA_ID=CAMNT_0022184849 /DNA_START=156 /DNA_END=514 /DNA_ORIENTATION=+